jgi:hypothetical protein
MSTGPSFSLELQPSTKMVNGVAYIRAVIALTDTNYTSFTDGGFSYFLVALTDVIDTNDETNFMSTLLYNTTFQATDKSNITFELPYTYTNTGVYTVAVTAFYDTNHTPNRVTENHTYLEAPVSSDYILLVGSSVDVDDSVNDPKQGQLLATISIADTSNATALSTSEYLVQAYTSDHTQFYNDTVLVQSGDYDVNLMENLIEDGIFLENQFWYLTVTAITGGGSIVLYGDAENNQNDTSSNFTPIKISNEPNLMELGLSEPEVQVMQLTAIDALPNDNYDITKIELTLTVTEDPDSTDNNAYNLTYTGSNLAAVLDTATNTYTFTFPDSSDSSDTTLNCGDDDSTPVILPQRAELTVTLQATNTYNDSSSDTALDSHEYTGPLQSIGPVEITSNKIDAAGLVVATQDSSGPKLVLTATYPAQSDSLDDISSLTLELTKNNDTTTWTIDVTDTNVTQTHNSNEDTFTLVIENGQPVTGANDSTTTMALAGGDEITISLSATNRFGTGNPKTDFTYNGNNNASSVTIQDAITFTGNVTASSLAAAITDRDVFNGDYDIGVTLEDGIGTNGIEDILNLNGITNYQLVISSFPGSDTTTPSGQETAYVPNDTSADKLASEVDLAVGDSSSNPPTTAAIQLTVLSIFDDSNSTETTESVMSNSVNLTTNTLEIENNGHTIVQPDKGDNTVTGTIKVPASNASTTNFNSATVTLHMYPNNNTSATPIDLSDTNIDSRLRVPAVTVTGIDSSDSSNNEVDYTISIDNAVYPYLLGSRIKAVATIETTGQDPNNTDTSNPVDSDKLIYLHDTPTLSYAGDRADSVVGNGSNEATVTPNGYTVSTVFAVDAADNTESLTVIAGGPDSSISSLADNNPYNTSFDSNNTPISFTNVITVSNISATDDYLLLVLTTSGTTEVNNNELVVSTGVTLS